jgi:hypothetical protein
MLWMAGSLPALERQGVGAVQTERYNRHRHACASKMTVKFLQYIALMGNDFRCFITVAVLGLTPVLLVILLLF